MRPCHIINELDNESERTLSENTNGAYENTHNSLEGE